MRFLLDTVALQPSWRRDSSLAAFYTGLVPEDLGISTVSLAETAFGVSLLPVGRRRDQLAFWLHGLASSGITIIPFNEDTAMVFGAIMAAARQAGYQPPASDGMIAATAHLDDLAVVTRNVADFASFGVRLVNPWADP